MEATVKQEEILEFNTQFERYADRSVETRLFRNKKCYISSRIYNNM